MNLNIGRPQLATEEKAARNQANHSSKAKAPPPKKCGRCQPISNALPATFAPQALPSRSNRSSCQLLLFPTDIQNCGRRRRQHFPHIQLRPMFDLSFLYHGQKKGSGLRPSSHSVPQQARSFSHFFDSNLLCSIPECILHGHPIPLLNTTRQRLAQRTAVRVEQRWTPLGFFNPYCLNDSILPFFVSSHSQRDFTLALSYIGTWKRFTVVRKAHHFFHRAMLVQQSHRDQSLVTVDLCELRQSQHHLPPAALLGAIVDDIDEAFLLLQIRQEPPGADHVIAHSQWWSMGWVFNTKLSSSLQLA